MAEWVPEGWTPEMQQAYEQAVAGMSDEEKGRLETAQNWEGGDPYAQLKQLIMQRGRDVGATGLGNGGAYEYGGQAGKAAADAAYFRGQAENAQRRPGEIIDYSQADWDRNQANYARLSQQDAMGLMEARAKGTVPSIAQMQADRQMGQAAAEQSSIAAGARGAAGLALANQQQAGNTAALQGNISNQAQINAAQERMAAEQAYYGAASGIRQGDQQSGAMAAANAQAQASINAQQRAQNDQYSQAMYGNEQGVNTTQLQAQGNKMAAQFGQQQAAYQRAQNQNAMDRADRNSTMGMMGSAAMAGMMMFSDVTAKRDIRPLGLGGGAGGIGSALGAPPPPGASMGGVGEMMGLDGGGMAGGLVAPPGSGPPSLSFGDRLRMGAQGVRMASPFLGMMSDREAKQDAFKLGQASAGLSPQEQRLMAQAAGIASKTETQREAHMARGPAVGAMSERDALLMKAAQNIQSRADSEREAYMAQGPAVGDPTTNAFAAMQPYAYEYKPGLGTPGQKVGPMAQEMASNPVTATAIRRDPASGLLSIDRDDGLKVALGGVGHLASKQEQLEQKLQGLLGQGAMSAGDAARYR